MRTNFTLFIIFLLFSATYAQNDKYSILTIADSLKQNANAVVRLNEIVITISSQREMSIKNKRIVTILNDKGLGTIDAVEYYDKSTSIKNVDAKVYNAFGKEIKRLKSKDFRDQSAVDGISIFSDNRLIYLEYTPTEYPFTILYESELRTSNTAFIPNWLPLNDYNLSVEKSVLNVNFPNTLGFKKKEFNFNNYQINKLIDTENQLSYSIENVLAKKSEEYAPQNTVFPKLMMGLEYFHLEGVDGNAKTWKEFGQWYSDKILTGTTELPEETISKIKALIGNEKDLIKKAKIVYNFIQQKSRYVSIQVGIGGFKPMLAKDVDRLGYGDCKALTNYTRAILNVLEVPSYNTILYGDTEKMDIQNDFVSMQGNHMILAIPNGDNYVWLECTSQNDPFGYQGIFTDDREVLVIKPEGGEIVRTKNYNEKDNSQISNGSFTILDNGDFNGDLTMISQGSQYSKKSRISSMLPQDKEEYYKDYFSNINNLKIDKTEFVNDKEKVAFTENLKINALNYATISDKRMMFVINAYNKYEGVYKKIRNRKYPFEIDRGYFDVDDIIINLPNEFKIEAIPNNKELKTKFGDYNVEYIVKDDKTIFFKRTMLLKKGKYINSEYEEFRIFMEQINKNDNAKIILIKK